MKLVKVGVACLNQTPLDWDRNVANIREAIRRARGSPPLSMNETSPASAWDRKR